MRPPPLPWPLPFAYSFFHESSSHESLTITLGALQICSKIRGDIHKSKCTAGAVPSRPVAILPGGRFAACVNDTGGHIFSMILIDY